MGTFDYRIRDLLEYDKDLTINDGLYIIQQYVFYRTGKFIERLVLRGPADIQRFEQLLTYACNFFKYRFERIWR